MSQINDQYGRPFRDLRVSVTDKCNFRCPYCMPIEVYGEDYEFAPKSTVLNFEEMVRLVDLCVQAGTRKLRITGGEPLVRKDVVELVRQFAQIEGLEDIALTTNGWFLRQHARDLKAAGLKRVTVSLDSLDDAVFRRMNGRDYGIARVLDGIEAALEAGLTPVKVNTVVKRGENEDSIVPLARWGREKGATVRYIEYMDVGNRNGWRLDHVVPGKEVVARIGAEFPLEPVGRGYRGEVAQRYRYADGQGEIGVITSISQPFCGDCTRARLSTDGRLVTCLFAETGTNLRDPLRDGASDVELLELITGTWRARTDRYSEERGLITAEQSRKKVEMYQIGG